MKGIKNIRHRLNALLDEAGLPLHGRQAWLIKRLEEVGCSITPPGVSKWFAGDNQPGLEHIIAMTKIFRVRLEWMVTGEGAMRNEGESSEIARVAAIMSTLDDEQQQTIRRIAESAFISKDNSGEKSA